MVARGQAGGEQLRQVAPLGEEQHAEAGGHHLEPVHVAVGRRGRLLLRRGLVLVGRGGPAPQHDGADEEQQPGHRADDSARQQRQQPAGGHRDEALHQERGARRRSTPAAAGSGWPARGTRRRSCPAAPPGRSGRTPSRRRRGPLSRGPPPSAAATAAASTALTGRPSAAAAAATSSYSGDTFTTLRRRAGRPSPGRRRRRPGRSGSRGPAPACRPVLAHTDRRALGEHDPAYGVDRRAATPAPTGCAPAGPSSSGSASARRPRRRPRAAPRGRRARPAGRGRRRWPRGRRRRSVAGSDASVDRLAEHDPQHVRPPGGVAAAGAGAGRRDPHGRQRRPSRSTVDASSAAPVGVQRLAVDVAGPDRCPGLREHREHRGHRHREHAVLGAHRCPARRRPACSAPR